MFEIISKVLGMIDPEIMDSKEPNKALLEFLKTVEFPYGNDKYL